MPETHIGWMISGLLALLSLLGTINAFLLGIILRRQSAIDGKLDKKVDRSVCMETRATCKDRLDKDGKQICDDVESLWHALGSHSHTGLPATSKVTR